jgi:PilZ domain
VTASNPANRRRSERVILQVPVTVETRAQDGKSAREEAVTSVVNAHGGLMKLSMDLKAGQPITLINVKAKMQQSCRVIRVETSDAGTSAVAFEFDEPAPKFWPITFPPEDWVRR